MSINNSMFEGNNDPNQTYNQVLQAIRDYQYANKNTYLDDNFFALLLSPDLEYLLGDDDVYISFLNQILFIAAHPYFRDPALSKLVTHRLSFLYPPLKRAMINYFNDVGRIKQYKYNGSFQSVYDYLYTGSRYNETQSNNIQQLINDIDNDIIPGIKTYYISYKIKKDIAHQIASVLQDGADISNQSSLAKEAGDYTGISNNTAGYLHDNISVSDILIEDKCRNIFAKKFAYRDIYFPMDDIYEKNVFYYLEKSQSIAKTTKQMDTHIIRETMYQVFDHMLDLCQEGDINEVYDILDIFIANNPEDIHSGEVQNPAMQATYIRVKNILCTQMISVIRNRLKNSIEAMHQDDDMMIVQSTIRFITFIYNQFVAPKDRLVPLSDDIRHSLSLKLYKHNIYCPFFDIPAKGLFYEIVGQKNLSKQKDKSMWHHIYKTLSSDVVAICFEYYDDGDFSSLIDLLSLFDVGSMSSVFSLHTDPVSEKIIQSINRKIISHVQHEKAEFLADNYRYDDLDELDSDTINVYDIIIEILSIGPQGFQNTDEDLGLKIEDMLAKNKKRRRKK